MWIVTVALILGVPWLAGRAFLDRVSGTAGPSPPGFAYPSGGVLVAAALGWIGLAGALRWAAIPWLLAAVAAAAAVAGRRPGAALPRGRDAAMAPCILLFLLVLLQSAATPIGGYDAIAMWSAKARAFWEAGALRPVLAWRGLHHADYPFLSSMLETWAYVVARGYHAERLAKLHQPLLLASFALALHGLLREVRGRTSAVLFGTLVLASPLLGRMATECWADLPLAVFNGLAAIAACRVLARETEGAWLAFGLMGGAMGATKLEGVLLFCAQAAVLAAAVSRRRGWRPLWRPALHVTASVLFVMAPWLIARAWLGLRSEYGSDLDLGFAGEGAGLGEHVARIVSFGIRYAVAARGGDAAPGDHALLFPYLAVAMVLYLRGSAAPAAKLATAVTVLQLAIHGAALVGSPHAPSFQLPVSVDRLLVQVAPVAFLAAALLTPRLSWPSGIGRGDASRP